jgi:hypothetical protein
MDKQITMIQLKWAERLAAGRVSDEDARIGSRTEVYGEMIEMGLLDEAMRWRRLLLVAIQ